MESIAMHAWNNRVWCKAFRRQARPGNLLGILSCHNRSSIYIANTKMPSFQLLFPSICHKLQLYFDPDLTPRSGASKVEACPGHGHQA